MEKASNKNNAAVDILKAHGLKVTRARTSVLELLMKKDRPLSIEEISKGVSQKMNTSTIYRILDQLTTRDIVYQTSFRDGKAYFEYQRQHHHHIMCRHCGVMEKIKFCLGRDAARTIKHSKRFHSIDSHMLEFFGTCKRCKD